MTTGNFSHHIKFNALYLCMDMAEINTAFEELINRRGIHHELGISSVQVRNYRQYLKNGQNISLDLKVSLLQKAGMAVNEDPARYSREDLVNLVKFIYTETVKHDPAYAVDKFLTKRANKGTPAKHVGDEVVKAIKKIKQK